MDAASLIPIPDAIPVSWPWLQFLLLFTFTLHLLFMNVMLGSAFIAWWDEVDLGEAVVGRGIAKRLTIIIALTINLGVAPLLFLQMLYGHFIYVSSILMAWYWLAIPFVLILAYYSAYLYKYGYDKYPAERSKFIGFALVIFLAIAFLFVNNMTMMLRPESWLRYFKEPGGFLLNIGDPMLWARYSHYLCGSVAVAGLYLALVAKIRKSGEERINYGLSWFKRATILQFFVGGWYLSQIPIAVINEIMAGSTPAIYLGLGIAAAIIALLTARPKLLWLTSGFTLLCLVFMIVLRDMMRQIILSPFFKLTDLTLNPQYSVFYLFLATLVVGLAVIAVMLKWANDARQEDDGEVNS